MKKRTKRYRHLFARDYPSGYVHIVLNQKVISLLKNFKT